MKATRGVVVNDEQLLFLRKRLGAEAARYHGFRRDLLGGGGGSVVIWPVDRQLAQALSAMKNEDITPPRISAGYEVEYVSRRAALVRGVERERFTGRWGGCLGRSTACAGHTPLGFFAKRTDATRSASAAQQLHGVDRRYRPERMEIGEDDDGEPFRPDARRAFARGSKLASAGKRAEARLAFAEVVALEPSFEPAHEALSFMSRELGDFAAMLESSMARRKLFPKSADAWMDISIARQNLRRFRTALAAIDRAVKLEPANGTLLYQRACVLSRAGRSAESLRAIAGALKLDRHLAREIREDDDFAPLRARAAFRKLVGRSRSGGSKK